MAPRDSRLHSADRAKWINADEYAEEVRPDRQIFRKRKSPDQTHSGDEDAGLISKIKFPGPTPELWVRPAFFALDFDTKQDLVSVIYAYYCDGNDGDMVLVFDDLTGKSIGSYSTLSGGLKLDN